MIIVMSFDQLHPLQIPSAFFTWSEDIDVNDVHWTDQTWRNLQTYINRDSVINKSKTIYTWVHSRVRYWQTWIQFLTQLRIWIIGRWKSFGNVTFESKHIKEEKNVTNNNIKYNSDLSQTRKIWMKHITRRTSTNNDDLTTHTLDDASIQLKKDHRIRYQRYHYRDDRIEEQQSQ